MKKNECFVLYEEDGDFIYQNNVFDINPQIGLDYHKTNLIMLVTKLEGEGKHKRRKTFIIKNRYGGTGKIEFFDFRTIR